MGACSERNSHLNRVRIIGVDSKWRGQNNDQKVHVNGVKTIKHINTGSRFVSFTVGPSELRSDHGLFKCNAFVVTPPPHQQLQPTLENMRGKAGSCGRSCEAYRTRLLLTQHVFPATPVILGSASFSRGTCCQQPL